MPAADVQRWQMLRVIGLLWLVFTLSFVGRMAWISHEQLALAHQAMQSGDLRRVLIHEERAIHPYLPLLPDRATAMREMQDLCRRLEQRGEKVLALEGWRRLRGALLAGRSMFGQPDRNVLELANREIARLASETDTQGKMDKARIRAEAAKLLRESPRDIHPFWGLMQFVMLMCWILATGRTIWCWADWPKVRRVAMMGVSSALFAGWLISLYLAG